MKAVLIDDMPQALDLLQSDLKEYCPDIEIIGTANSIVAGAKLLRKLEPDILFLDILLGDGTGFDLLEIFPQLTAKVIFVTASNDYAVRAFQFAAIDYLLKPVEPQLLMNAVKKAKDSSHHKTAEALNVLKETIRQPEKLPDRITLSTAEEIRVVAIDDIIYCKADGNNTRFFLTNGIRLFVTRTLGNFDKLLAEHPFMRTHQSYLVNLKHIQSYIRSDGGYLLLSNGDQANISVRNQSKVIHQLKTMGLSGLE